MGGRWADAGGRRRPGPLLFARYAYPPNELGYCGPGDPGALLGHRGGRASTWASSPISPPRSPAPGPTSSSSPACNGIRDPLDAGVVEAYWVGNRLLGRGAGRRP